MIVKSRVLSRGCVSQVVAAAVHPRRVVVMFNGVFSSVFSGLLMRGGIMFFFPARAGCAGLVLKKNLRSLSLSAFDSACIYLCG
mgnify:CR=1 FL=1